MPDNWPTRIIKSTSYLRGRIGWQGLRSDEFIEEGPYLVTGTDFEDGRINWDTCYHVGEARFQEGSYIHLRDGDVLTTKDGTVGKIAYVSNCPKKAVLNSGIFLLRCTDGSYRHRYMYHLLRSDIFRRFLDDNLAGSTIKHLYQHVFERFRFPAPGLAEQELISECLDLVDDVIGHAKRLLGKQQRIKTGLMQELLTKGIDEHRQVRNERTHEFWESPLGRIPIEWKVENVGHLAERITSGSRGWAKYYSDDGPIFLRIGNLTREHINLRLDDVVYVRPPDGQEGSRTQVQAGDILISITADLGIIGVIPSGFRKAYINQHIALIRLSSEVVDTRWAGHFMQGHTFQTQVAKANESGAKAGLNLPTVSHLLLACPESPEEQKAIVEVIDLADQAIFSTKEELRKLLLLRTGMSRALFSGRVSVPVIREQAKQIAGAAR